MRRRLIATLAAAVGLALTGCGSDDADPTSADPTGTGQTENETAAEPAVESVTMTRSGGIAGVHETWKVGPSDAGHRQVFEAASPSALDSVDTRVGKPICCDFFQYDLTVRYDDGSTTSFRMYDGGSAEPALERLISAVLKTTPRHADPSTHSR